MKILLCGDVVGRSGRDVVESTVSELRSEVDFIVVNADNAAHGFGISPSIAADFFSWGVDVITGGNHIFDQKDGMGLLASEKRLLRPANMADTIPGQGVFVSTNKSGRFIVIVHLIGRVGMPFHVSNPFDYMAKLLETYKLGVNTALIIVDFHAEATSEKNAMGHYLDGKVSAVVGTHTHVPTLDYCILPKGTAYQTDLGMCGDFDSVIGMQKSACIERFLKGYNCARLTPAGGSATFCGLQVETDDKSGLARSVSFVTRGRQWARSM